MINYHFKIEANSKYCKILSSPPLILNSLKIACLRVIRKVGIWVKIIKEESKIFLINLSSVKDYRKTLGAKCMLVSVYIFISVKIVIPKGFIITPFMGIVVK